MKFEDTKRVLAQKRFLAFSRYFTFHLENNFTNVILKKIKTNNVETTNRLKSGDSSVVTRWTVDQEVVGSNPTHGGNKIYVLRSLSGFTQPFGRMSTGFRWSGSST